MKSKEILKQAFIKSVPILCSYIVVNMVYGMMMENAGFQQSFVHTDFQKNRT